MSSLRLDLELELEVDGRRDVLQVIDAGRQPVEVLVEKLVEIYPDLPVVSGPPVLRVERLGVLDPSRTLEDLGIRSGDVIQISKASTPFRLVPSVAPGEVRWDAVVEADIVGPRGDVRMHQLHLAPAARDLGTFAVHVDAPEAGFRGDSVVVLTTGRLVGVVGVGEVGGARFDEERGSLLVFQAQVADVASGRPGEVVLTTEDGRIYVRPQGRRGANGVYTESDPDEFTRAAHLAIRGEAPPAGRPKGRRRLVTVTGLFALCAAAVAAALVLRDDPDRPTANRVPVAEIEASGSVDEDEAPTSEFTADETEDEPQTDAGIAAESYVQLASFQTAEASEQEARRLQSQGIDAHVVASSDMAELPPDFNFVLAGPIADAAEERQVIRLAKRAENDDAFARDLTPPTDLDPADLAGSWSGTFKQRNFDEPELNIDLVTEVDFDDSGQSAQVTYEGLCGGTLTLREVSGPEAVFDESVDDATKCIDGGRWTFKLVDDKLVGTYRSDAVETFVTGSIGRSG